MTFSSNRVEQELTSCLCSQLSDYHQQLTSAAVLLLLRLLHQAEIIPQSPQDPALHCLIMLAAKGDIPCHGHHDEHSSVCSRERLDGTHRQWHAVLALPRQPPLLGKVVNPSLYVSSPAIRRCG